MLQVKRVSQITVLTAPLLSAIAGVCHGFSTRRAEHNDFTLGPHGSEDPLIPIHRARFLAALEMTGWPFLKLKQTHSDIVLRLNDTAAAVDPVEGDAAITGVGGLVVAVQTADCVPILIADLRGRAVAAVHAGWRGTAARIAEKTVRRMTAEFGVRPEEMVAAIGPHNAVCCYEVGDDVLEAVGDGEAIARRPEWARPHLDQRLANLRQLRGAGIPEAQIAGSMLCTQCRPDLFYSHRREGKRTGRLMAAVGIQPA